MEKIFKAFKILFFILLFALAITFVVCLFAIPNETKDFVKGIMTFINQPLPIVGVSIATGGFLLYKIIDSTPIGRKGYKLVKADFDKEKGKMVAYKQIIENKLKETEKLSQEQIAILSGYSKQIDDLTNKLVKVCETSPNAKINALGNEIKNSQSNIKEEITTKVNETNSGLAEKVNVAKYDLETILKELNEIKEKVYGESKKTKDN